MAHSPSKRAMKATRPCPAKKAKTEKPEAPLLEFIKSLKELPKPCRDMLVAAVPICLEVVEADRHKFQSKVLARLEALVAEAEAKKRGAVSAGEAELAQAEGEKGKASADAEAKKTIVTGKLAVANEKGKVVDGHREVAKAAQDALAAAQKEQEGFDAKKAGLFAEQENFAKLLADSFEPLKDGTFTGNGSQRNKQIGLLKKKLLDVGAQASLADAVEKALKDKPEKRTGSFAKVTMQFSAELFAKHTAKVAHDISGLDHEAAGLGAATSAAEADLAKKKETLDTVSKEWDAMQDEWMTVENESAEAASSLKRIEAQIPGITKGIETAKAALEKFLEVPALLSKLKEESTAVPAEEEPAEEEDAEEEDAPMEAAAGTAEIDVDAVSFASANGLKNLEVTAHFKLAQVEIADNVDKFFVMQTLKCDSDGSKYSHVYPKYMFVSRWGRTGTKGNSKLDGPFDSAEEASALLAAKFKEKSGNEAAASATFERKTGKYDLVRGDDGATRKVAGANGGCLWQYWVDDGVDGKRVGWYDYEKEAAEVVESAYFELTNNGEAGRGFNVRSVQSGTFCYQVDFSEMMQTNVTHRARKQRKIRRNA